MRLRPTPLPLATSFIRRGTKCNCKLVALSFCRW
uniref:Uncharacterized protein n=1 Tax=Arundo donax TaxID=35708 RepID=A0A0A9A6J6_ARUDO